MMSETINDGAGQPWKNYKLATTGSFAFILLALAAIIGLTFKTPKDTGHINGMIIICGIAAGWLAGIVIAPYDEKEKTRFADLAKTVSTFVAGYIAGKIGPLLDAVFKPDFMFDSLNGFRALLFIATFLLAMIVTFVFRSYATRSSK